MRPSFNEAGPARDRNTAPASTGRRWRRGCFNEAGPARDRNTIPLPRVPQAVQRASMRPAPRGTGIQDTRKRLIYDTLRARLRALCSGGHQQHAADGPRGGVKCGWACIRSMRALPGSPALQERSRWRAYHLAGARRLWREFGDVMQGFPPAAVPLQTRAGAGPLTRAAAKLARRSRGEGPAALRSLTRAMHGARDGE